MDKDLFDYLDADYQRIVKAEQEKVRLELQKELSKIKWNKPPTPEEVECEHQRIEKAFWLKRKPELDRFNQFHEHRLFQEYGGTREAARKLMMAYEHQQQQTIAQQKQQAQREERIQDKKKNWREQQKDGESDRSWWAKEKYSTSYKFNNENEQERKRQEAQNKKSTDDPKEQERQKYLDQFRSVSRNKSRKKGRRR